MISHMAITSANTPAYLVPLAGPAIATLTLSPGRLPLVLGRSDQSDLPLPSSEERVSRQHARFWCDNGTWYLLDTNSRWGTFLNGFRLASDRPYPLHEGDLLRITPWTFTFRSTPAVTAGIQSSDDLAISQTLVHSIIPAQQPPVDNPLALLLECAAGIHSATNENGLAQFVVDESIRATGYPNAVWLHPLDGAGHYDVIAASGAASGTYSRALLQAASAGNVVELNSSGGPASQSIIQMEIRAAICVPMMLGTAVAAYLYLDARGHAQGHIRPNAAPFCLGLGRIASLALANIKRQEIEHRQIAMDAEMNAAAAVQRFIFPPRQQTLAGFTCLGESRPGQILGGDFFDVIELSDTHIAIALGDVTGKGITASVLMSTIHGFLHASLRQHGQVDRAVTELTQFLNPRRPDEKFVTLFTAILDRQTRQITYVDAGHGYGFLLSANNQIQMLQDAGGPPVGCFADHCYTASTATFQPGSRLIVVSDGFVEQPAPRLPASTSNPRVQFEIDGIHKALTNIPPGQDELTTTFAALIAHAGTTHLADDATMLVVRT